MFKGFSKNASVGFKVRVKRGKFRYWVFDTKSLNYFHLECRTELLTSKNGFLVQKQWRIGLWSISQTNLYQKRSHRTVYDVITKWTGMLDRECSHHMVINETLARECIFWHYSCSTLKLRLNRLETEWKYHFSAELRNI